MSKQKKFLLSSLLLTLVFAFTRFFNFLPLSNIWLSSVFITTVASLILFFVFYSTVSSIKRLFLLLLLPLSLLLSANFFYTLLPRDTLWRIVLHFFLFGGIYTSVLVANIFLVSLEFRTVPLYRAAFTVGFTVILFELFLFYNFIFSFKFFPWINMLLVFASSFFLLFYLYWTAAISEKEVDYKKLLNFSLVSSLFLAQMGFAISFWPVNVGLASLYLVGFAYVLGGMIQAEIKGRLFRRTFFEYFWVGAGSIAALLFLTFLMN